MPPPTDVWDAGAGYEPYVGRWSRLVAREFVDWLSIPPGGAWLDIGCGTGALVSAILERGSPRQVVGVDPSAPFLSSARRQVTDARVEFRAGEAAHLRLPGCAFDAVVSGLVLNFTPDPEAALREMVRVARPGAIVAAYVWDYASEMQPIRRFWDAAIWVDERARALDEAVRFPICAPDALARVFAASGLERIDGRAIDVEAVFSSFDDYWTPFLGGQGPAPGYCAALDEPRRAALRERLRDLVPAAPDGRLRMTARAFAIRASKR